MLVKTFQIIWHDKLPVLSCEFHSSGCLVTAGADHEIKVWKVELNGEKDLNVGFQGSISNHARAVNCVRFHGDRLASAGDGGEVMVWAPPPDAEDKTLVHTWKVCQLLRGHADDVIDLAWSNDGSGVVTTSIDNTVILWDTAKGKRKKCFSGHRHYVQGVAWDPLGEHILTNSTDRTMRVHKARAGKKQARAEATDIQVAADFVQSASVFKRPLTATEQKQQEASNKTDVPEACVQDRTTADAPPAPPEKAQRKAANNTFIFQDEGLNTFFRRLSFSPEGSFLVAPAATLGPLAPAPRCSNAAALFSRHCLSKPLALLPTLVSASTCVRFCPTFFEHSRASSITSASGAQENQPPAASTDCSPSAPSPCGGATDSQSPMQLPYRLVYAIGTTDSIFIYNTESSAPIVVLGAVHLKHITDLAWSPCGSFLAASSHDGYCTIAHFEPEELGVPLKRDAAPNPLTIRRDMQLQRQTKPKASKPKKASAPAVQKNKAATAAAAAAGTPAATGPQQMQLPKCLTPTALATTPARTTPTPTTLPQQPSPASDDPPPVCPPRAQQDSGMIALGDAASHTPATKCTAATHEDDQDNQDAIMIDVDEEEPEPSKVGTLSVAQLAAQAGQAANTAAQ